MFCQKWVEEIVWQFYCVSDYIKGLVSERPSATDYISLLDNLNGRFVLTRYLLERLSVTSARYMSCVVSTINSTLADVHHCSKICMCDNELM